MASRRMFASAVVTSARFLQMGQTARLLYYDLGMQADDEGVVEAFTVMRMTGASEDDLKLLAAKGFIVILNADFVSYLCDWERNNYIRGDRRQASVYAALLEQFRSGALIPFLCADSQLPVKSQPDDRPVSDSVQPDAVRLSVSCLSDDRQMSDSCQHRLGKDRLGQDRVGEDSAVEDRSVEDSGAQSRAKPVRHIYGQYRNVLLSDIELQSLQTEFPDDWQQRIESVSEYVAGSGKHYKNYLAVIRAWARKDRQRAAPQSAAECQMMQPVYDLEGLF